MPAAVKETLSTKHGDDEIVSSIPSYSITQERTPFVPSKNCQLKDPGIPRANIAASAENPHGSLANNYAKKNSHRTVIQQHCAFFDRDGDNILWPSDTFIGFSRLGFNPLMCLIALLVIHLNFAYPTNPSWIPDPFLRIYLDRAHKTKHGSDTGTFDHEGRFVPQSFEDIFAKYAGGRDYMTLDEMWNMLAGQRLVSDFIGWCGAIFEWGVTYMMLWPEDGKMAKEDIRGIFDGSLFYTIAEQRERKR